jgi:hypothetical protein
MLGDCRLDCDGDSDLDDVVDKRKRRSGSPQIRFAPPGVALFCFVRKRGIAIMRARRFRPDCPEAVTIIRHRVQGIPPKERPARALGRRS